MVRGLEKQCRKRPRRLSGVKTLLGKAGNIVAGEKLKSAVGVLSRGRVVVTDRLHGHILCTLLGIPHVLLDHGYGKVTNFYQTWTKRGALTRWARSMDEVAGLVTMWDETAVNLCQPSA